MGFSISFIKFIVTEIFHIFVFNSHVLSVIENGIVSHFNCIFVSPFSLYFSCVLRLC